MSNLKHIFSTLILSILLSFTTNVFADFSQEAGVLIEQDEEDGTDGDAFDSIVPTYIYYFKPVSTSKGPVDEAAFMQRITWLQGLYSMTDGNFGTTKYEGNTMGIKGEAYLSQAPVMIGFQYTNGELTYPAFSQNKTEIVTTIVSVSYFIQPQMAVSFKRYTSETETTGPSPATTELTEDTLGFKTVLPQKNSQAISIAAGYTSAKDKDGDTYKVTEVIAKYFLNNTLGIGGKYSKQTSTTYDNKTTLGVIFSMYIDSQFHLDVEYDTTSADDANATDGTNLQLMATKLF